MSDRSRILAYGLIAAVAVSGIVGAVFLTRRRDRPTRLETVEPAALVEHRRESAPPLRDSEGTRPDIAGTPVITARAFDRDTRGVQPDEADAASAMADALAPVTPDPREESSAVAALRSESAEMRRRLRGGNLPEPMVDTMAREVFRTQIVARMERLRGSSASWDDALANYQRERAAVRSDAAQNVRAGALEALRGRFFPAVEQSRAAAIEVLLEALDSP